MHHPKKRRISARAVCCILLALLSGTIVYGPPLQAQTNSVFTNLSQLTQAVARHSPVLGDINLDAIVFDCDPDSGALVLADETGAELLEMDGLAQALQPGDRIRIQFARGYFRRSDVGICVSAAPVVENDGLHPPRTRTGEYHLEAGRFPLRVDWFNHFNSASLEIIGSSTNSLPLPATAAVMASNEMIHVTHAECYEGNWLRVPNYQLLRPVKGGDVTSLDIAYRTRAELAGIRFRGYVDVPQSGAYRFTVTSDDGCLFWIGNATVPVEKIGINSLPSAPHFANGDPMTDLDERRLATVEGRVDFASRLGKGLHIELRSDHGRVSAAMANAGSLEPENLLNAYVRISGVASGILLNDQRVVLGRLATATSKKLAIIENAPGKGAPAPLLTTMLQVQSLAPNNAARKLPVTIRGVVTAVASDGGHWIAIQDETHGGFVQLNAMSNTFPKVGQLWELTGQTRPGDFAPIVVASGGTLLGEGQLPEPAHPTWEQLLNGSMDVQWTELQGVVTGVRSNWFSLLLPEGALEIKMEGWGESELKEFSKSLVRIRGTLFAISNPETHEVRVGSLEIRNGRVAVDKPASDNPFDAPEKAPRGLFLFDAKATPFQQVKVRGQVTYADAKCVFIENGSGIQVFPDTNVTLNLGDIVEAVGYPKLSGASPVLRVALVRKIQSGVLPSPRGVRDSELALGRLAGTRIRLEGNVLGQHREDNLLVLQMHSHTRLFLARVPVSDVLGSLQAGSKLSLTGIFTMPGNDASHFELLLNGPSDITVLSAPSWWTSQRLLDAVAALMVILILGAVWISTLRRQVAQRTRQLQREVRERERAERQHAIEAERSRIARDLHDDLGASLTEINVLASTGQRPRPVSNAHSALFEAIADKARSLIVALDGIVWAVDPEDNSLQSLADYFSGYTREYLSNSEIACRFKIPISFPDVKIDGEIRHELLMVVKEILNNVVRHAEATGVEFQMNLVDDKLAITIADNGKGFDTTVEADGHGLKNFSARLKNVGGSCLIESQPGVGTTVRLQIPMTMILASPGEEANTTFA